MENSVTPVKETTTSHSIAEELEVPKRPSWQRYSLLIIVLIVLAGACLAGFMLLNKPAIQKPFTSPLGYIKSFQDSRTGTLKIETNGYPNNFINGTYKYYVQDDGRVFIDALPEIEKVKKLYDFLIQKNRNNSVQSGESYYPTRYMELDFMTLLGYSSLTSTYPNNVFSLQLPELAKGNSTHYIKSPPADCQALAKSILQLIGPSSLNTTSLSLTNNKTIKMDLLAKIDANLAKLTNTCLEASATNQEDIAYIDNLLKIKHPIYDVIVQDDTDKKYVEFKDNTNGSFIRIILLSKDNQPTAAKISENTSSILETNSRFSLAYTKCRVAPVKVRSSGTQYTFGANDSSYDLVSLNESGYFCSTKQAEDSGYTNKGFLSVNTGAGILELTTEEEINHLKIYLDTAYNLEKYYLDHGAYPTTTSVNTKAVELGATFVESYDKLVRNNPHVYYNALPAGCTDCKDYEIQTIFYDDDAKAQVSMSKYSFEH